MCLFFFFKQKTAYEMRISDWSSDVCSSDLNNLRWSAIMAFVQLEGLGKRYGDIDAVVDTHLSVEKSEFVSLLGPSGCGKTTTLQMIAGFVEVSKIGSASCRARVCQYV